jgi:hypothetical protein
MANPELVLEIKDGVNGVKEGGELIVWKQHSPPSLAQMWHIDPNGLLRSAHSPKLCIDVAGGVQKATHKICLWTASC